MSLMQKLERLYNGLIGLVTVVLTLALLGVALKATLDWRRATAEPEARPGTSQPGKAPKIASADVVKRVVSGQTGDELDAIDSNDPNRAAYDRMGKAIHAFAQKHAVAADEEALVTRLNAIHSTVKEQETDALRAAYANGLADALEQGLADPRIEGLLKPADDSHDAADPMMLVASMVSEYNSVFTEQTLGHDDADGRTQQNQQRQQEVAWRSLARLGGPLLLAILVLQLLTFGRIERNTRGWSGEADRR